VTEEDEKPTFTLKVSLTGLILVRYSVQDQAMDFLLLAGDAGGAMMETHYPRLFYDRVYLDPSATPGHEYECLSLEQKTLTFPDGPGSVSSRVATDLVSKPNYLAKVQGGAFDPGWPTDDSTDPGIAARVRFNSGSAHCDCDQSVRWFYPANPVDLTNTLLGHTIHWQIDQIPGRSLTLKLRSFNVPKPAGTEWPQTLTLIPHKPGKHENKIIQLKIRNVPRDELDPNYKDATKDIPGFVAEHFGVYHAMLGIKVAALPVIGQVPVGGGGSGVTCMPALRPPPP
jgi:hypothetical protein